MDQSVRLVMVFSASFREQDAGELLIHLIIGQLSRPLFGHNDNVTPGQGTFVAPEKFPHQALHPVAPDGLAQTLGDNQSQARVVGGAGSHANAEMGRVEPFAPGLGRKEVAPPTNPICFGESGLAFSRRSGAVGLARA
jgi:hypothetical protein